LLLAAVAVAARVLLGPQAVAAALAVIELQLDLLLAREH
jgi:hypothetical protein